MEKKKITELNPVSIRNILTIRYDVSEKSVKKLATKEDFKKPLFDNSGHITEKLLSKAYRKIENYSRFSISLSGGIDSTLCLALLRKNFPETKITAFSGIFEDAFDESSYAKKIADKFDADFFPIRMKSIRCWQ